MFIANQIIGLFIGNSYPKNSFQTFWNSIETLFYMLIPTFAMCSRRNLKT